ncbi:MAG: methionine biosynthesis protein MetW [Gammaproteobacteria bacterium TMED30]|jgi:methionine biosynthesis protein MetW|nr:methionine biosynthesis protein MetW [Gammaproteobacteria bacterium]OUT99910.1 MAG: methionine biosynthesis protein MetW [Gammaproteobacteria bacterium TMED30]
MRPDLELVAKLIQPNSRVLDLGCGAGDLLQHLQQQKSVIGYGLDKDAENIQLCLSRGVNVIEQDLDGGLGNFQDDAFDMVIMTDTIQAVHQPQLLLREMLRVGRECVVTFPNFGHWRCRLNLAATGRMPVSKHLPHRWYDTPNIHLCTFNDFEALCAELKMAILQRRVVDQRHNEHSLINLAPNLLGSYGFYHLGRTP